MKETFGEYIHKLRTDANMTLTKLAAALDVDQSTLSKIENRKRPVSADILPKLANTFDLDIKELEQEYYSEKIADIIFSHDEPGRVLKLAEEKAIYMRSKKTKQGKINF